MAQAVNQGLEREAQWAMTMSLRVFADFIPIAFLSFLGRPLRNLLRVTCFTISDGIT